MKSYFLLLLCVPALIVSGVLWLLVQGLLLLDVTMPVGLLLCIISSLLVFFVSYMFSGPDPGMALWCLLLHQSFFWLDCSVLTYLMLAYSAYVTFKLRDCGNSDYYLEFYLVYVVMFSSCLCGFLLGIEMAGSVLQVCILVGLAMYCLYEEDRPAI